MDVYGHLKIMNSFGTMLMASKGVQGCIFDIQ